MSKSFSECDVAVVGGGPAGLVAAKTAAEAGASVILFERDDWLGGRLGIQSQPLQGPKSIYPNINGFDLTARLASQARDAGVVLHTGVNVSGMVSGSSFTLTFESDGDRSKLKPRAAILATGSTELWVDFPGSDLEGVMLSGDTQAELNVHGRLVGHRFVILGSDNAGLLIAQNLLDAGAEVAAVLEEGERIVGRPVNAAPLAEAGVRLITSATVICATGDDHLSSIRVSYPRSDGVIVEETLDADVLCLALPRSPDIGLATEIGCPTIDAGDLMGGPVPIHDRTMNTSVAGMYICGDASGVENGAASMETGRLAGLSAAEYLELRHSEGDRLRNLARGRLGYLRRGRRGAERRQAKRRVYAGYRKLFVDTTASSVRPEPVEGLR